MNFDYMVTGEMQGDGDANVVLILVMVFGQEISLRRVNSGVQLSMLGLEPLQRQH